MSYDGWIHFIDPDGQKVTLDEIGNYTSNVSRMWSWAVSLVVESPMQLKDTEGWTCEKAAPVLTKAAQVMCDNRAKLEEMNPENGWGDYEGALQYLDRVASLCRRYRGIPSARLEWWC